MTSSVNRCDLVYILVKIRDVMRLQWSDFYCLQVKKLVKPFHHGYSEATGCVLGC